MYRYNHQQEGIDQFQARGIPPKATSAASADQIRQQDGIYS